MQAIYHAPNQFNAQLIVDLLQSEGIEARILRKNLMSALSDLLLPRYVLRHGRGNRGELHLDGRRGNASGS